MRRAAMIGERNLTLLCQDCANCRPPVPVLGRNLRPPEALKGSFGPFRADPAIAALRLETAEIEAFCGT